MHTQRVRPEKVTLVTLGCAKNLVDSEDLYTQLKGNNFDVVHEDDRDAHTVVVNTCGFIDNAKKESIDTILRYARAKEEGVIQKLYVSGCLSERYKDDLQSEIPEVDAFFGTRDVARILHRMKADYKKELVGERLALTPSHYAYLKISEGCDRPCSFCAIPLMRGKHRSKPIEELVKETEGLVNKGAKEILIIAQDSTFYGLDLYKKRNLADLLRHLSDVKGVEWLRLHYAFPTGFPMDVLEVMRERSNICNYLDIPLQTGSSEVLKIMRRGISREKTETLLKSIREKVPGIAIRTTLIAGHPGETDKDFKETLDFVERNRFDRLGVFTYSHEEDTHAYTMPDTIPQEEKERRAAEIMEVQQSISAEINAQKIGNTFRVLIDRKEGGNYIGRTEFDSPEVDNEVILSGENLPVGDFVNARIDDSTEFDLYATPL